jgi:hypothetical protein
MYLEGWKELRGQMKGHPVIARGYAVTVDGQVVQVICMYVEKGSGGRLDGRNPRRFKGS